MTCAEKSLRDILDAIGLIRKWIADRGGVEQALEASIMRSAIERQLLAISDASIGIDADFRSGHAPEIDWDGVREIGDMIFHRYDEIDGRMIRHVLCNELEALEAACRRVLSAAV